MSRHCQVTGATPGLGRNVPWPKKKINRRLNISVQAERYWVPSLGWRIRLTAFAKGIKMIGTRGISAVVVDLIARGRKL